MEIQVKLAQLAPSHLTSKSEKSVADDWSKPLRRRYQAPSQKTVDKLKKTIKRYQQRSGKHGDNTIKTTKPKQTTTQLFDNRRRNTQDNP